MNKIQLPQKCFSYNKNVWVEYIQMVADYNPLDLGQGHPDFAAPEHVVHALKSISESDTITSIYCRLWSSKIGFSIIKTIFSTYWKRHKSKDRNINR